MVYKYSGSAPTGTLFQITRQDVRIEKPDHIPLA